MANKPVTIDVGANAQYSSSTFNANFATLEDAIENCLGRGGTGESPNSMTGDLDMDANDIINVDNISVSTLIIGGSAVTPSDLSDTRWYNNLAALKLTSLDVGSIAATKEYSNGTDYGGAYYLVKTVADYGGTPDGYVDHYDNAGNVLVYQPQNNRILASQAGVKTTGDSSTQAQALLTYAIANEIGITVDIDFIAEGLTSNGFVNINSPGRKTITILTGSSEHTILTHSAGLLQLRNIIFNGDVGTAGNYNVLVNNTGSISATECDFTYAVASGGYGDGLRIATTGSVKLINCDYYNNDTNGLNVSSVDGLVAVGGSAHNNGANGYNYNNFDLTLTEKIRGLTISNCQGYSNGSSGFVFGNPYNDNDQTGDDFGWSNDVINDVAVTNCIAYSNVTYGFVLSMNRGNVDNCIAYNNTFGGVLCNGRYIDISNPLVVANPGFGLDIGHGTFVNLQGGAITGNSTSAGTGLVIESSTNIIVDGTSIGGNGQSGDYNIKINAVGGTGAGKYFPTIANTISLRANVRTSATSGGLWVRDNPNNVTDNNTYTGDDPTMYTLYSADTGRILIQANAENKTYDATVSSNLAVFPDISDHVNLNTTDTVNGIQPYSYNYLSDKVAFIEVTAAGSGYDPATTVATISGDGTGATGLAIVNNGELVGVRVNTYGSGYTTATVSITGGGGSGATATATVGIPLFVSKRVTVASNQAQTITRAGDPILDFPSATATLSAPVRGCINLRERYGKWVVESSNYDL